MNKQKGIIIGVLALAVTMMVGYALFSETITINGTATAKGEFNMEIVSASITNEVGSTGATASVIDNGNKLSITVPRLEYPGAYVDVTYNVKNSGTIDALYTNYNITGESERIKADFIINNLYYAPNETKSETIRIYWDENNNTETEETATIVLGLTYGQVSDKQEACSRLKTELKTTEECAGYIIYGEENCPTNKYDLNHDSFIDGLDLTNMEEYINITMECPTN